jgi:hypothetical protein
MAKYSTRARNQAARDRIFACQPQMLTAIMLTAPHHNQQSITYPQAHELALAMARQLHRELFGYDDLEGERNDD